VELLLRLTEEVMVRAVTFASIAGSIAKRKQTEIAVVAAILDFMKWRVRKPNRLTLFKITQNWQQLSIDIDNRYANDEN